jgi:hypothetical protein
MTRYAGGDERARPGDNGKGAGGSGQAQHNERARDHNKTEEM